MLSLNEFDEATDGGAQADGPDGANPPLVFNIILRQTFQECVACGIWFEWQGEQENKAKFVVQFESLGSVHENTYQHGLNGMENAFAYFLGAANDQFKHSIIVKQAPQYTGLFRADISDIPPDATITKATLYLHINTIEGLADADNSSVLSVHECERTWDWDYASWTHYDEGATWTQPGGDFGVFVREIRAKEDIRDRGFSRASPNVDFDFTPYVLQLQAARSQT